jgi:hypothetical protein
MSTRTSIGFCFSTRGFKTGTVTVTRLFGGPNIKRNNASLFICGLFNYAAFTSYYITLNDEMAGE